MKQRLQAWSHTKILPVVSCFIFNDAGQLLLLQRHSDDLGGGQWGTPGGRLEEDENAEAAVRREINEETGLDIPRIELLGVHEVRMPHGTIHLTGYKTRVPSTTGITIDPEEHHAYSWFDPKGILDEDNILWGLPTMLRDFGLIDDFGIDPTLSDGSEVILLKSHAS